MLSKYKYNDKTNIKHEPKNWYKILKTLKWRLRGEPAFEALVLCGRQLTLGKSTSGQDSLI